MPLPDRLSTIRKVPSLSPPSTTCFAGHTVSTQRAQVLQAFFCSLATRWQESGGTTRYQERLLTKELESGLPRPKPTGCIAANRPWPTPGPGRTPWHRQRPVGPARARSPLRRQRGHQRRGVSTGRCQGLPTRRLGRAEPAGGRMTGDADSPQKTRQPPRR